MTNRHAEIVGAGFAGLTAACALAQRGWSVRVHERADALRTTGAGIYIYENGLRVLEAVGAYEAAVKGAPFAHTREVRDDAQPRHLGAPLGRQPGLLDRAADRDQRAGRRGARAPAPRSCSTRRASPRAPTATLTLADGRTLKADLVVAADGSNSRLRDGLGLLAKRKYLVDGCTRLLIDKTPEERGTGRRHHDRILVRQPARALHAVQRDRGLYRAHHARQRRGGEGDAGRSATPGRAGSRISRR